MKFSEKLGSSAPKKETPKISFSPEEWPKIYYEEQDAAQRLALLKAAIEAGCDPEADDIRMQLFKLRYEPNDFADSGYADAFMRAFMNLSMIIKNGEGRFMAGLTKKKIRKQLDSLALNNDLAKSEPGRALLLNEFRHAGQLYIALSADSKQYNALILGIGKISDDALIRKLYKDLSAAGKEVADTFDMRSEMELWLQGLEDARSLMLPSTPSLL